MSTTVYRILWDNGHACGEFPWEFATEDAARAHGEDWVAEANAIAAAEDPDFDPEWDGASFDIIEDERPDPEDIDAAVEQTLEYFDRYIAGDR